MPIAIDQIFNSQTLNRCKVHAARWNGEKEPLDVFLRSNEEWLGWNKWRGAKDEFNADYICAFIQFYPENSTWLFGGFFQVIGRSSNPHSEGYKIEEIDEGKSLIGRLKLTGKVPRGRAFRPDTFFQAVEVSEILKEPYEGSVFAGYEKCSLDFTMLEILHQKNRVDWITALSNINGVYVIADKATGKKYIGSAYGECGVWQRWSQYVKTGHGWNKQLVGLADTLGLEYLRANFKFTLLESLPLRSNNDLVIARENYWKAALLTREFGYNGN